MVHPETKSDPRKIFGETLRSVRLGVGMSQEELAHRAALDRTYVSSCERGRRNVSLETIVRLADALDVPPSALLSGLERSRGDR
ncbi:helix-turn-helix domain-containing protein [Burkholderia thailandensis]|uniref:helix-turn-helix domain-containing protein n=1 Tax=Burkholderia thailandensis TaxID=57975 RepID=UPI0005724529|nr:helix-turn-helix transcriptional regulator [Burkholderia thailandensis]MCS3399944.1 helix-turn-helix domain-containing protein [Burkholderia thailandensis]MCS6428796.1 helix-turn-helix domain-containing protein [Burkholderia thailandensis]MCS6451511.1 helix-turn-helix domain-containing protein [Burkholderia thailandensis]MCS6467823.1 helix-turn-helix domain-containing protein [Burkholderia thailandensis]MCS6484219.1 helix-turn-helix domain-containing protein [Burkholderia thailandensis]